MSRIVLPKISSTRNLIKSHHANPDGDPLGDSRAQGHKRESQHSAGHKHDSRHSVSHKHDAQHSAGHKHDSRHSVGHTQGSHHAGVHGNHASSSNVVPDIEEGYPPPRPPTITRTEVFHPRDFVQVDQHVAKAPGELAADTDTLVDYLVEGLTCDVAKLRAIYRWVVSQHLPLSAKRGGEQDDSPLGYLLRIRDRKATYSEFFARLCRHAGLQCAIIHGLGKGVAYEVGTKVGHKKMKNSWNAVFVKNGWHFVHPYWASHAARGFSTGTWAPVVSDSFHLENVENHPEEQPSHLTSDFYFLPDPSKLIVKCLPDNPEWQLLHKHLHKDEFEELPFLQPAFYELGLKLVDQHSCVIHSHAGRAELRVALPEDKYRRYKFQYKLYSHRDFAAEGEYEHFRLDRYLFHYKDRNMAVFEIRFPVTGDFKLQLHCTDPQRSLQSDWICDFRIKCSAAMIDCVPLPVVPALGWGPTGELDQLGIQCLSHDQGLVSLDDGIVTFVRFSLPNGNTFELQTEMHHYGMSQEELWDHVMVEKDKQHAVLQIAPPCIGEFAVQLFVKSEGGEARRNICNFLMQRKQIVEDPELADIRRELVKATTSGSVETLQHWIGQFMENDMEDQGELTRAKKALHLSRLNRDVTEAIARKDLSLLERTLNNASETSLKKHLGHLAADAEAMRSRLRRLARLSHAVMEMDSKTISEMRSYPKPPSAVHGVMVATLLLLGNKENDVKKWKNVQSLLSKRGKAGIKKRVEMFNINNVGPPVVQRAQKILNKYDLESVQIASTGAATFYQWALSVIGEVETAGEARSDGAEN